MILVEKEYKHPLFGSIIQVARHTKNEYSCELEGPALIGLTISDVESYTSQDLIEIGSWIIKIAKEIQDKKID